MEIGLLSLKQSPHWGLSLSNTTKTNLTNIKFKTRAADPGQLKNDFTVSIFRVNRVAARWS